MHHRPGSPVKGLTLHLCGSKRGDAAMFSSFVIIMSRLRRLALLDFGKGTSRACSLPSSKTACDLKLMDVPRLRNWCSRSTVFSGRVVNVTEASCSLITESSPAYQDAARSLSGTSDDGMLIPRACEPRQPSCMTAISTAKFAPRDSLQDALSLTTSLATGAACSCRNSQSSKCV